MIRSRVRVFFLLAALLLVAPSIAAIGSNTARAQEASPVATAVVSAPPLAEAMPADTAAYVATEFDPTSDQYLELSGLAAQLIIPGAGDTIAGVVQQLTKLLALIPSDLNTVLKGEIGVGVSGFGELDGVDTNSAGTTPGNIIGAFLPAYAIVLYPIEAGRARELVEDWFVDQVAQRGGAVERSQSGAIVVLRDPTVNSAETSAPAVVTFAGDYILLGTDSESLLPFIETAQGIGPSLADSDDLRLLNESLPAERLLFGYLDSSVFFDSAGSLEIASIPVASLDAPFGPTAFTVAADDAGLRIESVSIPVGIDSPGSAAGSQANPDFASRVPESTLALFAGQDLGQSWVMAQLQKVLLTTLAGAMGSGDIDLSDFEIEEQFGFLAMLTGVNFKTDLIDQLQGDYGAALFALDLNDPLASSAVIASGLGDTDEVAVAVTSLGPLIQSSGAGTASVTTASIDAQTVTNVTLGLDGLATTIQYGVVDDQLMVGLGDGIETIAISPTATLEDSASYQAALAELPSSYDGVLYVDVQGVVEQLAPLLLETLAENAGNPLVQCLAGAAMAETGTPVAVEDESVAEGNWALDLGCSILTRLLGGNQGLLDLVLSRVPGPLAAVTYDDSGLQRTSGILLVGSIDS